MKKNYTIETRLRLDKEQKEYLKEYIVYYNEIYRYVWKRMTEPDFKKKYTKISIFVTEICNKFKILKRTANTIRNDVQGRIEALIELKKLEKKNLENKINAVSDEIEKLKEKINESKSRIEKNELSIKEMTKYKNMKEKLYYRSNKINKMKQKYRKIEEDEKNNRLKLCFGSKKMFKAQNNLEKNGYKTHEKWRNEFRKNRDKNIGYLGSSDETCGNQMFQMRYDKETDTFCVKIRKEKKWEKEEKYIEIENVDFKYQKQYIKAIVKAHDKTAENEYGKYPLTYRIKRRKNKWYLQIIITIKYQEEEYITDKTNGAMGIDYNEGFIEMSEIDGCGNLVGIKHYDLKYHGTGEKAKNEIRKVLKKIAEEGKKKNKPVVIENLDFKKTKSKKTKEKTKKGKKYNKMVHVFDYSRYKETLENVCFRERVELIQVNPANTSKIGKRKYCEKKKLSIHQAASYVIARRGKGIKEKVA